MNNLDKSYCKLLQDILDNGVEKTDRTGTGTISVFGRQIRHKMSEGFPLLTTKKMAWNSIVVELLWFLRGDTNIKYLVDNNCHIWDGDAFKKYETAWNDDEDYVHSHDGQIISSEPRIVTSHDKEQFINRIKTDSGFAERWGELGPIYGKQWRNWGGYKKVAAGWEHGSANHFKDVSTHDQIEKLISDLKKNPDSRRLMVNAWNVEEIESMTLPPCHYGFQVYTRELSLEERQKLQTKMFNGLHYLPYSLNGEEGLHKEYDKQNVPRRAISLMWNQRSVDTFLGLPFNIASYGLLLEIIAKEVNMIPDELIGNLGDVHLYSNHIEQAKEQIGRPLSYSERVEKFKESKKMDDEEFDAYWNSLEQWARDFHLEPNSRTRTPFKLPNLVINDEFWNPDNGVIEQVQHIRPEDFFVENYQSHPTIKAPLSN